MCVKSKFFKLSTVLFSIILVFESSAESVVCGTKCFAEILGRVSFYSALVDEINFKCGTRLDNFDSQLDTVLYERFSIRISHIKESEVQPKLIYRAGVDSVINELLSEEAFCEYEVDGFYLYLNDTLLSKDFEFLKVFKADKYLYDYFHHLKKFSE